MLKGLHSIVVIVLAACVFFATTPLFANVPGGGTSGANVTLTDNGDGTVTMANGIASITFSKTSAQITTINYTFNNTGSPQTLNLVSGNPNGGKLYWENSNNQGLTFSYAVVSDPANNGGNYAEVVLSSTTVANVLMEVHYSMSRGNTGFYVTPIFIHRSTDGAFSMGECRDNIYAGSIFNWMSVDAARNRLMSVSTSAKAVGVNDAPVEVSLWTNGIYAGRYEDKYKYGADFGLQRAWGWSSVGNGGKNIGLWNISASVEYYSDGPMKRDLMEHIGTTILNMINGGHYGSLNQDANWAAGEVWSKVYGPYFIYFNNISSTITSTNQAAQMLYADALAQASAEATAWPYSWFTNTYYAPAGSRGTVKGQIVINDIYNPGASGSNLWVGLVPQPASGTTNGDFQFWVKPYQFWVKTDANGNFTIPDVIIGTNYTLFAFGPGAAGTFQSQALTNGANSPNTEDIPASPFAVAVTAGATNDLGVVTWTPYRSAPTAFEIGYPNRSGDKFKHGDDWWVGDIGPSTGYPSPIWTKHLEYQFDYPSGPTYTVGTSRWSTDWNFIQPSVPNQAWAFSGSTSTINFNLPSAPVGTASFYIALSSDYQGPLIVQVNGSNIAGSTGFFPNYNSSTWGSDVSIREANHGVYSDMRTNFSATLLHAGLNTIKINMRKGDQTTVGDGWENHAMYDYIRLEVPNYIPPAPAAVTAYAGNNCALLCWPVQPGATGYNILRSTTSGLGYISITNGVIGPVCGSGYNNATYLDRSAANGTTYYYVVQSVNPVGSSVNSTQGSATPSAGVSTAVPAAPASVTIGSTGHQSVTVNWSAVTGANFYTVYRSTLFDNGGGVSNVLNTIALANNVTTTTYTDTSPTDGSTYGYFVTATSAAGTSTNSIVAVAEPLPSPPSALGFLTATPSSGTNIFLYWPSAPGAVGYVIQRATSLNGGYVLLDAVTETNFTDVGINTGPTYYYKVTPMNAAGVPADSITTTQPSAPAILTASAGNTNVALNWSPSVGAVSYALKRSTTSAAEVSFVSLASTNYTDAAVTNGKTYYYVVAAVGTGATSGNSPEASATPAAPPNINTAAVSGNNLTVSGSGGITNWTYYVLSSTNLTLSTAQWTRVTTNHFDASGNFVLIITNGFSSTNSQMFYRLQLQ